MREPPGPLWGRAASCCLLPRQISGRRAACLDGPGRCVACLDGSGRCVCRWAAARPRDRHTRACGSEWSISRPALALPPPTGTAARPRRPRGGLQSVGVSVCCRARPRRRPPAPRSGPPAPPAPSTPAGPGVLVCCSSFRNFACNSPPVLCWFVSVCNVTPLVFVNCMRLLLSAGPAVAHRHRGWAVLTFPVLQADQTGCVRG